MAETEEMERAADFVNAVVAERERQMRSRNLYAEQESLCWVFIVKIHAHSHKWWY